MSEPKKGRARRPNLTAREARFCALYAEHGNITRAHRDAGFEGASENAHAVAGRKLLRKAHIRDLIRRMQGEALDAAQITTDRIAQGLARIAFADRADLFDDRGRLLPPRAWPADVAATVEGVESEDLFETVAAPGGPKRKELVGYARKVKTARRTEALKVLAQWKRMVGPDVPPLDVLLGALPPDIATVVLGALAKALTSEGDPAPSRRPYLRRAEWAARREWTRCSRGPSVSFSSPKRGSGPPGRYTAAEVRAALEADAEARGVGVIPLVIECRRTGEWGEERPPGVYYEDREWRLGPTIVFDGAEPSDELTGRFRPKGDGPGPLFLVLGPEPIEPPDEDVGS